MRNIFEKDALTKLAIKAKKGDALAAEKLYEDLFDKVFGFCMNRTSNRVVSEDLTQDIFLKLVDKIETFDESKGNFLVWFWQLARNTVIDYYRKAKEINFSEMEEERLEKISPTTDQKNLDFKIEFDRVHSFVKTLSNEERELFELHFVADMKYEDIGKMLEKSNGALRVAVSRLKQKIRANLS
ncbi:MAG: RNA polymerase sigma factor [Patescibacteria group bacterium]